jgi:hypothetical protein
VPTIADFDSAIRRFDPSGPSQKLSLQNNEVTSEMQRSLTDSVSRHVAKISVCFQGLPNFAGGSARHGRDMIGRPARVHNADAVTLIWLRQ